MTLKLWRSLDDKSRLLLLTGLAGLGSQLVVQFDGARTDPALVTMFGGFVLMALGFRLDQTRRNGNGK